MAAGRGRRQMPRAVLSRKTLSGSFAFGAARFTGRAAAGECKKGIGLAPTLSYSIAGA